VPALVPPKGMPCVIRLFNAVRAGEPSKKST